MYADAIGKTQDDYMVSIPRFHSGQPSRGQLNSNADLQLFLNQTRVAHKRNKVLEAATDKPKTSTRPYEPTRFKPRDGSAKSENGIAEPVPFAEFAVKYGAPKPATQASPAHKTAPTPAPSDAQTTPDASTANAADGGGEADAGTGAGDGDGNGDGGADGGDQGDDAAGDQTS
jgi:hypothetical protein